MVFFEVISCKLNVVGNPVRLSKNIFINALQNIAVGGANYFEGEVDVSGRNARDFKPAVNYKSLKNIFRWKNRC